MVVVVCRLKGFSVDEVDASPLLATHARTIPVESINGPELKKLNIKANACHEFIKANVCRGGKVLL